MPSGQTTQVVEQSGEVAGLADVELRQPRTRPVRYTLILPEGASAENPAKGLLVYIPGFGDDTNIDYVKHLLTRVAEHSGHAGLAVEYHCYHSRPATGAAISMGPDAEAHLQAVCAMHHIPFDNADLIGTMRRLEPVNEAFEFPVSLLPPNNEYQNFGVLQALDHLCVLNHLLVNQPAFDPNHIVVAGSSHGGYIGHLMAKFAPNTIQAIIDNSSYVRAPLCYLGVEPEYRLQISKNVVLACRTLTHWQFATMGKPHYYGTPQALIRETHNKSHLMTAKQAASRPLQVLACNCVEDFISPLPDKLMQQARYLTAGHRYELLEVTANMIDGRLFKMMGHGMDASMKLLIEMNLPKITSQPTTPDVHQQTRLQFDCADLCYTVQHLPHPPYLQLTIEPQL